MDVVWAVASEVSESEPEGPVEIHVVGESCAWVDWPNCQSGPDYVDVQLRQRQPERKGRTSDVAPTRLTRKQAHLLALGPAVQLVEARAVRKEHERLDTVDARPARLRDALDAGLLARELARRAWYECGSGDLGNPKFRSFPWHVGMSPLDPAEPERRVSGRSAGQVGDARGARGRPARRRVEIRARGDRVQRLRSRVEQDERVDDRRGLVDSVVLLNRHDVGRVCRVRRKVREAKHVALCIPGQCEHEPAAQVAEAYQARSEPGSPTRRRPGARPCTRDPRRPRRRRPRPRSQSCLHHTRARACAHRQHSLGVPTAVRLTSARSTSGPG